MHLAVSLVVVIGAVTAWAQVCVHLGRWERSRRLSRASDAPDGARPSGQRFSLRGRLARRARPLLPEGHRPPPGLGPLSPSERFLRQESARGLRELQLFLLDQRTA